MIWWLSNPGRARSEMAGIAELQSRVTWLGDVVWGIEAPARLVANFTIQHLDRAIQMQMEYPAYFPDAPPQVMPLEKERLSLHQYGAGGELCLEFRPDNWSPDFTGAMMIESAHRLLSGETPSEGQPAEVPSAHRSSLGQKLRGSWFRLLVPAELRVTLVALEPGHVVSAQFLEHLSSARWLVNPIRLGPKESPLWSTEKPVEDASLRAGFAIRLAAGQGVPSLLDRPTLRELLTAADAAEALTQLDEAKLELPLLIASSDQIKLVSLPVGSDKVYDYDTVDLPLPQARLAEDHARLIDKSVAIVGSGSIGSKVAASLARAGIGNFVLVDDDILIPGNLVRNDLDARSVGVHKADAVGTRIKNINPAASVAVHRRTLGGQEPSSSADGTLVAIATCDLIIDATADADGFNLGASVARRQNKPMVWAEVFAGGIGGIIARSRPDLDPPPQHARRQLLAWCEARGVPWDGGAAIDYDLLPSDRPPLIADDAAVSIVAGHLVSLATDILLEPTESRFLSSAYAIGFAKEWIFSGPFDVWPIAYSPEGVWGEVQAADHVDQLKALVEELLPGLPADGDES